MAFSPVVPALLYLTLENRSDLSAKEQRSEPSITSRLGINYSVIISYGVVVVRPWNEVMNEHQRLWVQEAKNILQAAHSRSTIH